MEYTSCGDHFLSCFTAIFFNVTKLKEEKLLKIIEGAGGGVEGLPNGKQLVMKSTVSRCSVSTTNTSETIILSLIPSYISIFISYRKHQLLQKIEQPWSWPCNSRTCWYQSENVLRMLVGK